LSYHISQSGESRARISLFYYLDGVNVTGLNDGVHPLNRSIIFEKGESLSDDMYITPLQNKDGTWPATLSLSVSASYETLGRTILSNGNLFSCHYLRNESASDNIAYSRGKYYQLVNESTNIGKSSN